MKRSSRRTSASSGREFLEQLGRGVGEFLDFVAVGSFDQRFARGEVAVQRADADLGRLRDAVERGIRVFRERRDRDREQSLAIALRVFAQARFGVVRRSHV